MQHDLSQGSNLYVDGKAMVDCSFSRLVSCTNVSQYYDPMGHGPWWTSWLTRARGESIYMSTCPTGLQRLMQFWSPVKCGRAQLVSWLSSIYVLQRWIDEFDPFSMNWKGTTTGSHHISYWYAKPLFDVSNRCSNQSVDFKPHPR